MTPNLLQQAGQALYGRYFREQLAQALRVDVRTVRRWLRGDFNIPPGVTDEVRALLQERGETVSDLLTRIG